MLGEGLRRGLVGFTQIDPTQDHCRRAAGGEDHKARPPAEHRVQPTAEHRSQHRPSRHGHGDIADPARRLPFRHGVADHGQGQNPARNDRPLEHPEEQEHPDVAGQNTADGCSGVDQQRHEQNRPPAVPVRHRPDDQLQHRRDGQIAADRQADKRIVRVKRSRRVRKRRQEHVERQDRKRGQQDQRMGLWRRGGGTEHEALSSGVWPGDQVVFQSAPGARRNENAPDGSGGAWVPGPESASGPCANARPPNGRRFHGETLRTRASDPGRHMAPSVVHRPQVRKHETTPPGAIVRPPHS